MLFRGTLLALPSAFSRAEGPCFPHSRPTRLKRESPKHRIVSAKAPLFPAILAFSAIGVYSVNSNAFDLFTVGVFGLLGYVLVKLECEPAPLLLGFILVIVFMPAIAKKREQVF